MSTAASVEVNGKYPTSASNPAASIPNRHDDAAPHPLPDVIPVSTAAPTESTVLPGAFVTTRGDEALLRQDFADIPIADKVVRAAAFEDAGEAAVKSHHEKLFVEVWGVTIATLTRVRDEVSKNIARGHAFIAVLEHDLQRIGEPFVGQEGGGKPYTGSVLGHVIALRLFAVACLVADIVYFATRMLVAQPALFGNSFWRAAFGPIGVLLALSFLLKARLNLLDTPKERRAFAAQLLWIAIGVTAAAIPLFAINFANATSDPIAALTARQTAPSVAAWIAFSAQIIACNLAAAAAAVNADYLSEAHRQPSRALSDGWKVVKQRLDHLAGQILQESATLGRYEGRLHEIDAKRDLLVSEALRRHQAARADAERFRAHAASFTDPTNKN